MDIFEPITFYYILTFATSSIIIILAIMLLGIHIPFDDRLSNFRIARNYLSLSYLVLGISSLIGFFSQQEAKDKVLLASCTLIIASYQALLFTYTLLTLIQPLYIKQKHIFVQLGIITAAGIFLLFTVFMFPYSLHPTVFCVAIIGYFFQISYYTYTFRHRYKSCIQSLEQYYEENEHARLRWVNFCFYCALAVGILALMSIFLNLYFHTAFSILYTAFYTYIVYRFYNYQFDFKFAIPVITQKKESEKQEKEATLIDYDGHTEESNQLKKVLEKWVEEKKFTQKDISIIEIAESLGVNRSFLQYYFRTYMQTDFRMWRSELRIAEAQRILKENPDTSLESLREKVGFNHRANFHQQFQKITGMTPTEYKNLYSTKL